MPNCRKDGWGGTCPECDGVSCAPPTKDTNPKSAIGEKKVPLSLCSPIAEAHWALAQFAGLTKYGAWNWRAAGVSCTTYTNAIRRHLAAYLSGEELDPVDGTHHLGNIMACCAILLEADTMNLMHDDRPPSFSIRGTYRFVEEQMVALKVKYADMNPRHYTIDDTPAAEGLSTAPNQP